MRRAALFGLLLLVHCSGSSGAAIRGSEDDAGVDAAVPPSTPKSTTATDGGGCRDVNDEPDDLGRDDNCDGADGVVGRDVYVSSETGADTNIGTPSEPLRALRPALALAASRKGHVLALRGSYPVEDALGVEGAWSLHGGYQDGFHAAPKRELTILVASGNGVLIDKGETVTLAHVTIHGGTAVDPKQPSAHALRAKVAKLLLDDDILRAGEGGSMRPSAQGAPGHDGVDSFGPLLCDGVQQPVYTSGASADHASAEGKPAGNADAAVRAPQASSGKAGTDGRDATDRLTIAGDFLTGGDTGERGHKDATSGYGAAGGGGSVDLPNVGFLQGGSGGSGGCPGAPGEGGVSGGSSVALLVLAGNVTVRRSHLETGIAGNGGTGGEGGPGGHGGWGGSPSGWATGALYPDKRCKQSSDDPLKINCAAWGGIGGSGGVGGHGGGGAGGWSIGVVTVGAATATLDAATDMTLGPPGTGGVGNGGGFAPNGKRAEMLHLTP